MTRERRFTAEPLAPTETGKRLRGYAAVYNKLSEDLGGFREIIAPGAFDGTLNGDIKCLVNHDMNLILARSKNGRGTLSLGTDSRGLWYALDLPATNAGRDLAISLERGDVDQSSFGFVIGADKWSRTADGTPLRTIVKVSRLFDVSAVSSPAYTDTSAALASLKRSGITGTTRATRTGPLGYYEAKMRIHRLGSKV